MTDEQDIVEFTLTAGELQRLSETLIAIQNNHRDDEIDIVTVTIMMEEGEPALTVLVREYDGDSDVGPPLARYVVNGLGLRDDLAPLEWTDLRPQPE